MMRQPKVLLVDDSEELREVYHAMLEAEGYDIRSVENVAEALVLARSWRPDVVITDIFLGAESGLDLIRQIRSDLAPPLPPVIAISGFPEIGRDALRTGATRFLTKPVDYEDLFAAVTDVLLKSEPAPDADERARARRAHHVARLHAAAESVAHALAAGGPDARDRIELGVRWLSRYFGGARTVALLQNTESLEIVGTSAPERYPVGAPANGLLCVASRVMESGSNLLLPDLNHQPLLQWRTVGDAQLLASVPIAVGGIAVGALCLIASEPLVFSTVDLQLLEHLGKRLAHFVEGGTSPQPFFTRGGMMSRSSFEFVLGAELRSSAARTGQLAVTACALKTIPNAADVLDGLTQRRISVGDLRRGEIAVLVSDEADLDDRLDQVLEHVKAQAELEASATLILGQPFPRLPATHVLDWVSALLTSVGRRGGSTRVDCRPTASAAALGAADSVFTAS